MNMIRTGLKQNEIALRESLFHVANGYLGVRGSLEEGVPPEVRSIRGAYLNAFYDLSPIFYAEKMHGFPKQVQTIVNIPDVQGIRLTLNGEEFSPFSGTLLAYEQELDMSRGLYIRHVLWRSPNGLETEITFRRMASFSARELLTFEVTVTPKNWSGSFEAASTQNSDVYNDGDPNDPRKASEKKRMLKTMRSGLEGDCLYMLCETLLSRQTVASAVTHTFGSAMQSACHVAESCNTAVLRGRAAQGEAVSFVKWCVYTDGHRYADPLPEAVAVVREYSRQPIALWYDRQKETMDELWESARVEINGQPALQAGVDFAVYSLFQSAGRDGISSIASKGLSGEGYEGHYFWDTEIYMFPFFLLTNPYIARKLLDFRYETLDEAKEQARLLGHSKGALYPWRTITGSECSAYFPSGSAQYHINSDIAHAVITYYFITGDLDYMRDKGAEILIETSRLWLDTGHWYQGQFRIDGVTGPDEYTCLINNNYYTNLSVQYQLRNTLLICDALQKADPLFSPEERFGLTEAEKESFREAGEKIYLPFDPALGIYAQDDSFLQKEKQEVSSLPEGALPLLLHYHPLFFYRRQICKQADAVLGHFLYEDGIPEDVIRRTYEYYETITTHDSSLSPCVFSMMAARTGDPEKAYAYYQHSVHLDMENKQRNTDDGIHAANMGGMYMGIVYGFAGFREHADGISLRPCIAGAIESYAFPFLYKGHRIRVAVDHESITLRCDGGGTAEITVYGTPYTLSETPLSIPLQHIPKP